MTLQFSVNVTGIFLEGTAVGVGVKREPAGWREREPGVTLGSYRLKNGAFKMSLQ